MESGSLCKRAKQVRALRGCAAFSKLPELAQDRIVDSMVGETYESGEVVCAEGEKADRMYLLMRGSCTVSTTGMNGGGGGDGQPQVLGNLKELDVFGESALFSKISRSATVRADDKVEVLMLSKTAMVALVKAGHLDRAWAQGMQRLFKERRKQNKKQETPPVPA